MAPEVRIAVSYHHDNSEVARQLHQQLQFEHSSQDSQSEDWSPGWGLLFVTERYAPAPLLAALSEQFPDIPLFGGSTIGQICHESVSFGGYGVQLILFPHQVPAPTPLLAEGLSLDPFGSGIQLASEWSQLDSGQQSALLLFDSLGHSPSRSSTSGQSLVDGLNHQMLLNQDSVAGCAMLANEELGCSWLLSHGRIVENAALLLVLPPQLRLLSDLSHGNRPISRQLEVTATDGNRLIGLNGRPALQVLQELLDIDPQTYAFQPMRRLLSIGQLSQTSKATLASNSEHNYLSRAIVSLDPELQTITLGDSYLTVGDRIQFMCRDQKQINSSLLSRLEQLEQSPLFDDTLMALYFNCAGRYAVSISREQDDVRQISQRWPKLPMGGIYTAGEVAIIDNKLQSLNWSGVIALLCWDQQREWS